MVVPPSQCDGKPLRYVGCKREFLREREEERGREGCDAPVCEQRDLGGVATWPPARAWRWRCRCRRPVHMSPESTRPYTSRPSFAGRCKLAADVCRAGTHGRVPAMVGILMAHVGREFAGSCSFLPHVCRREACPVHFCPQFTGPPRTGGRRVPRGRPPVLVRPEFRAGVQTRRRCVPARRFPVLVGPEFTDPLQTRRGCVSASQPPPHTLGATLQDPENWGRVRIRGAPAPGRYSFTCTWGRSAYPWKSPMYTK